MQDAFVRSLDWGDEDPRFGRRVLGSRLRNAAIDHQRRRTVRRIDDSISSRRSWDASGEADEELAKVACGCILELADTLKPEYADALRRIEVDQVAVKDYAAATGISASNAGVRSSRAREALRKQVARSCGTCAEHGCLDCNCQASGHP